MGRLPCIVACLLLLTACESDEEKLRRLKLQEAIAMADALIAKQRYDSATRAGGLDTAISRLRDSMLRAEDRYDLARRDLARFLR